MLTEIKGNLNIRIHRDITGRCGFGVWIVAARRELPSFSKTYSSDFGSSRR